MSHDECTCCRHWRSIDKPSAKDIEAKERREHESKVRVIRPRPQLPPKGLDPFNPHAIEVRR